MDAREWLKVGSMGSQAYTFSAGVWWAWRHHNSMCFNNEFLSLNQLSFNIHSMIDIFTSPFSFNPVGSSVDMLIKWNNENFSCVILNVDGSCLGSPVRAGYGEFFRNNLDFYLSSFSGFIRESSDIMLVELYAIYQGFTLAKDLVVEELICYPNSLLYINLIKGRIVKYHVHVVLIQDIKEFIFQRNVTLCHTEREINVLIS
jgi:ribonuclease HI